jgi:hypothetical protein
MPDGGRTTTRVNLLTLHSAGHTPTSRSRSLGARPSSTPAAPEAQPPDEHPAALAIRARHR